MFSVILCIQLIFSVIKASETEPFSLSYDILNDSENQSLRLSDLPQ